MYNIYKIWKDKTILLVEDELVCAILIEQALAFTGVKFLKAKNYKEAINHFILNPKLNLILIDIQLPEKSGIYIINEIRKLDKEIPIVVQTAYAMQIYKDRSFEAGCNDYITKPYDDEALFNVVKKYI